MDSRVVSQTAQFEERGSGASFSAAPWQNEMYANSPVGKLEHLVDGGKPGYLQVNADTARAATPAELDHSHLGGYHFGSLAITNGPPASPAYPPVHAPELRNPIVGLHSASDFQSEDYSSQPHRKSWMEHEESGNRFEPNRSSFSAARTESALKMEYRSTSDGSSIVIEQLPDPRVLNRLSRQVKEPVVKLAELINADEEDIDLSVDESKISGMYQHSRNGSTQSRVSMASQYLADIPASPFETDSPAPENGNFASYAAQEAHGDDESSLSLSTSSVVHNSMARQGDNSTLEPKSVQELDMSGIPIPGRKPFINSRPSHAQSDDSGYSSAFDMESGAVTKNNSFIDSSMPVIGSRGPEPYVSYTDGNRPVSRDMREEYDQHQPPPVPIHNQPSSGSPVSTSFPNLDPRVPSGNAMDCQYTRPQSRGWASPSMTALEDSLRQTYEPKSTSPLASKSMQNLLDANQSAFSASAGSVSSAAGTTKRVKSERRKSIKNVFGLFSRSSDGKNDDLKNNPANKSSLGANNISRVSLVSVKSEKLLSKSGEPRKKLQKKKSQRLAANYGAGSRSQSSLVPSIPADMRRRLDEREGRDVYVDMPTTIGVPYEATQRAEPPMFQQVTLNTSTRQLPQPPNSQSQEMLANGGKNPERRFSLSLLTSKRPRSSANLPQELEPESKTTEGRPSSDSINDNDYPSGYIISGALMNDSVLGMSPYDLGVMHPTHPPNAFGHGDPRGPPSPGHFQQQPHGRRPQPPTQGPGGPHLSRPMGPGGPGRPMSYYGRQPPPRRIMQVVGEGAAAGSAMGEGIYVDVYEGRSMSMRSASGGSMRIPSNGTVVRPKSSFISNGPPRMDSPSNLAAGNGYPYPQMRTTSNSSMKRMSMPVHAAGMNQFRSSPDLRDDSFNRNSRFSQPPRSPRIDEHGESFFAAPVPVTRFNSFTGFHAPPPIPSPTPNGSRNSSYGPPQSTRLGDGDYLQRPVSRSSSIMSGRSTGTAGPRPYPGPAQNRNSMMSMESLSNTVGSGPYPSLPRPGPPPNSYAYDPRSNNRMSGVPLPGPRSAPKQRPMSTMMMGMATNDPGHYPQPPFYGNSQYGPRPPISPRSPTSGSFGPRPISGHSMRSTSGISQRSTSGYGPQGDMPMYRPRPEFHHIGRPTSSSHQYGGGMSDMPRGPPMLAQAGERA
jgi:hypothetical protein